MYAPSARGRFEPGTFFAILAIHLGALLAFHPYFFSWWGLGLCLLLVWGTASLGVSLTYHRLLSHGSTKVAEPLRIVLLVLACLALQGGPIRWSATHRLHHRESDHEEDPHSPLRSFWWSHILWNFYTNRRLKNEADLKLLAPDLYRDPLLRWMDRWFPMLWVSLALLTFGIGFALGSWHLGLSLVVWGSLVRTTIVWHNTWFVNSATHLWGYRNYKTADDSRNLWWVSLLTFGEGWHNNHHAIAGSARFGHKWWEYDPTWWALCTFKAVGWVKQVNSGPRAEASRAFAGKVAALSAELKSHLAPSQRAALSGE